MSISGSTVKMITNNILSHNGNSDATYGGAISIENSNIKFMNNTFTSNIANHGGAISFK